MLSLRLLTIAQLVKPNSKVLDVGTDHAYLPIYLRQMKICKEVIASDISPNALLGAQKNIERFATTGIKLVCSDGLEKISDEYDTLVISGMGTNTIIHILKEQVLPNNVILSSNNNLYELRQFMNNLGYKIVKEVAILDKGKYYDIIAYEKGKEHLSRANLEYGKSNNKEYLRHLYQKEKFVFKEMNFLNKLKKIPKLIKLKGLSI